MSPTVPRTKGNLPNELTSFVGRRQATADLRRELSKSRLVTLTGSGGVGKSRLALNVARRLQRAFPDGVWLVELAETVEPSLVPSAVAAALGVIGRPDRDVAAVLVDHLATRRLLLLLDNCEHLLDACARLSGRLLSAAPGLRMLATSREPLGIPGERVWPVPPLSIPPVDTDGTPMASSSPPCTEYEAPALFQDRASAVVPGFTIRPEYAASVVRLCRRLDGIPLAIELAAVRVRNLSVDQVLARLEDRFRLLTIADPATAPRHRTLRAAVEWSFDLCDETERVLWARCSVFAGQFDLEAAEAICAYGELSREQVLPTLASLIDKSVVVADQRGPAARYRMLDTIRRYGLERLAEPGETAALRRRHRDYYLRLADHADADSRYAGQAEVGDRLRAEKADLWAALDYCATMPGEARAGLRMAAALWYGWVVCGFIRDGRYWLDRLLALDTEPSGERATALWISGWLAHGQGERATSRKLLQESRDLAEQLGDDAALTYVTQIMGDSKLWAGDLVDATRLIDEALGRHRAAGRWPAPALLVFVLQAQAAILRGDPNDAVAPLGECRALCDSLGERWVLSWTEWTSGVSLWLLNEPQKAYSHLCASLRDKPRLNDRFGIPCSIELLAWVAVALGDFRRAALLSGGIARMWEPFGTPLFGSEKFLAWSRTCAERARAALGDDGFDAALREGAQMREEQLLAYALGEDEPDRHGARAGTSPAEAVLTKREWEVATLVARGFSNKRIATELVIAERTAEGHVENILHKLGFDSRTKVVGWIAQQRTWTAQDAP